METTTFSRRSSSAAILWALLGLVFLLLGDDADSFILQRPSSSVQLVNHHSKMISINALFASNSGDMNGDDSSSGGDRSVQGVTLKLAVDQSGGVADLADSKSERFTCAESLDMVHRLRRDSDAVLVGRRTVECDDCTLTIRRVAPLLDGKTMQYIQPIRVILDPRRKLSLSDYKIATDGLETIIYYHDSKLPIKNDEYHNEDESPNPGATYSYHTDEAYPNVQWIGLMASSKTTNNSDDDKHPIVSTKDIIYDLQVHHQLSHIMVEGGPATARQFLNDGMVDRLILVRAPMSFTIPAPSNLTTNDFERAGLTLLRESTLGVDRVEYWSRPGVPWPTTSSHDKDDGGDDSFWP
jgi:riboflavin biosynthesis pyrimidine reductase